MQKLPNKGLSKADAQELGKNFRLLPIADIRIESGSVILNVRIWTPPRLQVICQWLLARLHTYIRPLEMAYVDAGP